MHTPHRRIVRFAAVLPVVAALGVGFAAGPVASASTKKHHPKPKPRHGPLSGSWSGTYSGAFSGTFNLRWTQTGSKLKGTIYISGLGSSTVDGNISGSSISFGTVGGTNIITYTGTFSSKSMSGSYKTPRGGGPWSAHKTS